MSKCEAAETLITREADEALTAADAAVLEAHVATCDACRARRQAGLQVARALAQRSDAPVPPGFAARVRARVFREEPRGWMEAIDWRRWTEWMLPVAATLLVIALAVGRQGSGTASGADAAPADATPAASSETLAWTGDIATVTGLTVASGDASSDDLLGGMLGMPSAGTEGK